MITAPTMSPNRFRHYRRHSRRRRFAARRLPLGVEQLESRDCPSTFYELQIIAQTGGALTSIEPAASINDSGKVAFVASTSAGQSIYVGDGTSSPQIISFPTPDSTRTYGRELQINNQGKVAAVDRDTSGGNLWHARTWDANNPGSDELFGRGITPRPQIFIPPFFFIDDPAFANYFDALFSSTSISNDGQLGLAGLDESAWHIHLADDEVSAATPFSLSTTHIATHVAGTFFRFMAADGDRAVVASRNPATGQKSIVWYDITGSDTSKTIATAAGTSTDDLGIRPGISDEGLGVAFARRTLTGDGIWLSIDESGLLGLRSPIQIAGPGAGVLPIAMDSAGNPIEFSSVELDSRIGVIHQSLGASGLEGDSFIVAFVGTASKDSPLGLFRGGTKSLWTVRVDVEKELQGSKLAYHVRGAIPVAQEGESILVNGRPLAINTLAVSDPIAKYNIGNFRGNHRVAFFADTSAGQVILQGLSLDEDQDGLLNHWEINGLDIDQDGVVDLRLQDMGADPFKRDLFLELDFLADRNDGINSFHSNTPDPKVIAELQTFFDKAPALSEGAITSPGITLHVDAGAGRSVGMGSATLQGGDRIPHSDVIYFGLPGGLVAPANATATAFHSVKQNWFGTSDKRARELVFHYLVWAEFHSFKNANGDRISSASPVAPTNVTSYRVQNAANNTLRVDANIFKGASSSKPKGGLAGDAVKIISGKGAGQIRTINENTPNELILSAAWSDIDHDGTLDSPDSSSEFVIFNGSGGVGESFFYSKPDYNSMPGNDILITFGGYSLQKPSASSDGVARRATPYKQLRTVAHELGHNFGLRHSGTTSVAEPGIADPNGYRSIMSYAHSGTTLAAYAKKGITPVESYSTGKEGGHLSFNDWDNLKMDFFNSPLFLGNTFHQKAFGPPEAPEEPEPNSDDDELINGHPEDQQAPTIIIVAPTANQLISIGSTLVVHLNAIDDLMMGRVWASKL